MMKKALLILTLALALTACGEDAATETTTGPEPDVNTEVITEAMTEPATEEVTEEVTEATKDTYGVGEEWIVDGQWKLTVHSAEAIEERNEYADTDPAEVVMITYSYENLGYEDDVQDLYITPDRVIDGKGKMAATYPASIATYPQPTPVGASIDNVEDAWGLDNVSDTIKIMFEVYDMDFNAQKATFEIPVTK